MCTSVEEKLRRTLAKLADKNVKKISVSSLCEKADISRASFYIHYNDMEDLIDKTRQYIINKLDEQLNILLDIKDGVYCGKDLMVFNAVDISLLKGFTGKHVYWDFAVNANSIIFPRYEKKMIERWGEEYYNKNKEKFEFLLNGGVATLYFDLLNYDKETYNKNLQRIAAIAHEFFQSN